MKKDVRRGKTGLSEEEIDQAVISEADDMEAWESPVFVKREEAGSLSLPSVLAARAAFLARLHHKASVQEWLTSIIEERIDFEEAAFIGLKRTLIK